MKKYIGIVRLDRYCMAGLNCVIKVKTYDNLDDMNKWFEINKNSNHVLLENTEDLERLFNLFYDNTPVSEEEIIEHDKAKRLYKKLMEDT